MIMNNNFGKYLFVCVFVLLLVWSCSQQTYDLVIHDGTIIDGSGAEGYQADIGISDGKTQKIGKIRESQGNQVIDAGGKYVVPGFIDMHTHCDNIRGDKRKAALNYLTQGVTTVVSGNCGSGTYKVEEYFKRLKAQGIGVNVVHLVGQGAVRFAVLKNADRTPTEEELEEMRSLVDRAMSEGAAGLSTGLFYAPGSYTKTDEVVALCEVVKQQGGIYATHIRDESTYTIGLEASIREAIEIGERADVPVQISHIKALGKPVWGKAEAVCQIVEEAQSRGVTVYADQYPYNASSTGLVAAVVPRWVQADGKMPERLKDTDLLPQIKKEMVKNIERRGGADTLVISSFPEKREWEGKSLQEISTILSKSEVDTAIELILLGGPGVISFNQSDEDVEFFMQKPWVMTGSDGSVQVLGDALPHPRSYGTFPRKIRRYVLEKKLLTMEQAIRSASGLPAEMLGLKDRGQIKEGYMADIVIFDPETIRDKATFESPHQYSEGILHVLINGISVIENGEFSGTLAGSPLTPHYGDRGHREPRR
jgi:N-acyl-D-aspartate/D-glutamate deacylase